MWIGIRALVAVSMFAAVHVVSGQHGTPAKTVLAFQTMLGNRPDQPINGIESDDLPWKVAHAQAALTVDGRITVDVMGLVLTNDPSVPPELRNTNPSKTFQAVVSSFTEDDNGELVVDNVATKLFPATSRGNSLILDQVELPNPCIAPIVLILDDDGSWIAATGLRQ